MATPEGKVKKIVKEQLKALGAYWHMPVQNGLGSPSLDFNVCYKGHFIAIETKADGKQPTPRQENTMREITAAGGLALVISTENAAKKLADTVRSFYGD